MSAAAAVEAHFRAAERRMAGLPVCNPALSVELRGWRELEEGGWLGVLITPWCMNLLWLPAAERPWPAKGATIALALVSGEYEFVAHADERLGRYASASLYSPMQDFASQEQARGTADEVLALIFQPPAPPVSAPGEVLSRRGLFRRVLGEERPG